MAKPIHKALQSIPQDVQSELLRLAILRKALRETREAYDNCHLEIMEKLIGTKMDSAFISALGETQGLRAATRSKAVRKAVAVKAAA